MDTTEKKWSKKGSSRSLQRNSKFMNSAAPPSEDDQPDPALLERLGLLLGDHRVSKVKTQNHPHPLLSHNSHSNTLQFNSSERKNTKISNLTTSPASTLSDKGIGSSVGSFDSEFRNSKTGSLDSRKDISPSHSRTDSGINNHARSSSDIIGNSDIGQPTLQEQLNGKLWNKDPRRGNNGENIGIHPLAVKSATIDLKPKRLLKKSHRSVSSDKSESDKGSKSDLTKLPPVCPSRSQSNSTSSRDITPSASYTDINRRDHSKMHANVFSSETQSLASNEEMRSNPIEMNNNNSHYKDQWMGNPSASSSEQTLLHEEFARSYGDNYTGRSIIDSITGATGANRPSLIRSQSTENGQQTGMHLNIPGAGKDPSNDFGSLYTGLDNVTTPTNDILDPMDSANDSIFPRMRTNSESGRPRKKQPLTVAPSLPYQHRRGRSPQRAWNNEVNGGHSQMNEHVSSAMSAMRLERTGSAGRIMEDVQHNPSPTWDHHRSRGGTPTIPVVHVHNPSPSLPVTLPSQAPFVRHGSNRSSTRSNPTESRKPPRAPLSDLRVSQLTPHNRGGVDLNLLPIYFELPNVVTTETKFVGRGWLFTEILSAFNTNNSRYNKGVLIYGGEGHGKTSILNQLASTNITINQNHRRQNSNASSNASTIRSRGDYGDAMQRYPNSSNYSSRSGSPQSHQYYHQTSNSINYSNASSRTASPAPNGGDSRGGSRAGSATSLGIEDAFRRISSQVVAVHYCSKQDNNTCFLPEFIHSIAAQLAQAPMLAQYRELLMREPSLKSLLRIRSCMLNPAQSFHKGIIEPLISLRQNHKIAKVNLIVLIDGLGEAEQYRPDHGHSIISFLEQHLKDFPDFFKIIATCKSEQKTELLATFPLHMISLDADKEDSINDIKSYISHRISSAPALSNLTLTGKPDTQQCQKLLTDHLLKLCQLNLLYLRLVLDLLERRQLVPKSSGFKVIPINMSEVFLLMCNLKFQTSSSFDRVRDILSVALASVYPLKDDQIYRAITSGQINQNLPYEDFRDLMDSVSGFLVLRPDQRRSFIHPAFREWLVEGSSAEGASPISTSRKFLIDARRGHALLATVLSRQPVQLTKYACIELAHHLLKAKMFKGQSRATGVSSNELHALWMAQCNAHLSDSLTVIRYLFYPNLKVSKLLLRAGANPNAPSQVLCEAPAICVSAHTGCLGFVELLLQHGADINLSASNGMTALAYAAAAGHYNIVQYLINQRARLDLVDRNGHSPLLHAISRGHTEIAKLILTCNLFVSIEHRHFTAEQALVAATTIGNLDLTQYLLENPEQALRCNVNVADSVRGETPLTAAASRGRKEMCEILVDFYGADIEMPNKSGYTPLLCAVKHGEWATVEYLLNIGAYIEAVDTANRTPLLVAASYGYMAVLEILLKRGAILNATDKENLTALAWASMKGHVQSVEALINHGIDIGHKDTLGRTALDLASFFGFVDVVHLLLDAGADPSEKDRSGMTALDRAISSERVEVVEKLLEFGSKITATSWAMASGKTGATLSLLKKTADDGNNLYKAENYEAASEIYTKALRHIGEFVNPTQVQTDDINNLPIPEFRQLCSLMLLGLARCSRKLKDLPLAECAATRALHLIPGWYEALYVRARVRRELSRLQDALEDVQEAQNNAPKHNSQEINRLIIRIREDLKKTVNRRSFTETSDNPTPNVKARHHSHSGPNNAMLSVPSSDSRSSSPHIESPPSLPQRISSQSTRPTTLLNNGVKQLPHLYPNEHGGISSADSMPSLHHLQRNDGRYPQTHFNPHANMYAQTQGVPSPAYRNGPNNYNRSHSEINFDPNFQTYNNMHTRPNNAQQHGYNQTHQGNGHIGNRVGNGMVYQKSATPPLPPKTRAQNDPRQAYRSMSNLPYTEGVYKKSIVTDL